jgi:glycosyltransferase involved in cell wall biosynthesis
MKISVIVPIYNEAKSIPELFERIFAVLTKIGGAFEIITVNDGSRDESATLLNSYAHKRSEIKVIHFRVNAGQTAAIHAGIEHATGDIIIPIDSDLENNPDDIPRLLEKMNEGYDVVSGWRKERWVNKKIVRKIPSVLANKLISLISGVHLHDYGCTLKAYRASVVQGVNLYGEMHRFIPAYAAQVGARVTEVEVTYAPRKYGTSNYGFSRTTRVLLDLLVLRFLYKYKDRPMQFFGLIGFTLAFFGMLAGLMAIYLRLVYDLHLVQTPLPVLSALGIIVGVQLITMGILAEMVMRTYYESQGKKAYLIKETINL